MSWGSMDVGLSGVWKKRVVRISASLKMVVGLGIHVTSLRNLTRRTPALPSLAPNYLHRFLQILTVVKACQKAQRPSRFGLTAT